MRTEPFIEPAYQRVNVACAYSGASRSAIYRLLAEGKIRAVKSGRSTLIDMESLRSHLANLPAATFRQSQAA